MKLAYVVLVLFACWIKSKHAYQTYTLGAGRYSWASGIPWESDVTSAGYLLGSVNRRCTDVRFVRFFYRCNSGNSYSGVSFSVFDDVLFSGKSPMASTTNRAFACTGNWQSVPLSGAWFSPNSDNIYGFYGREAGSIPTMWEAQQFFYTGYIATDVGHDIATDGYPSLTSESSYDAAIYVEYETQCDIGCNIGASSCIDSGGSCPGPCDYGCNTSTSQCYDCDDYGAAECTSGIPVCCNGHLHECVGGTIQSSLDSVCSFGCNEGSSVCDPDPGPTDPCEFGSQCTADVCCDGWLEPCNGGFLDWAWNECVYGCEQYSDHCDPNPSPEDPTCQFGSECTTDVCCFGWLEPCVGGYLQDGFQLCQNGCEQLSDHCDGDDSSTGLAGLSPTAATVGGIVGAVVLLVILGFIIGGVVACCCCCRRNRFKGKQTVVPCEAPTVVTVPGTPGQEIPTLRAEETHVHIGLENAPIQYIQMPPGAQAPNLVYLDQAQLAQAMSNGAVVLDQVPLGVQSLVAVEQALKSQGVIESEPRDDVVLAESSEWEEESEEESAEGEDESEEESSEWEDESSEEETAPSCLRVPTVVLHVKKVTKSSEWEDESDEETTGDESDSEEEKPDDGKQVEESSSEWVEDWASEEEEEGGD